MDEVRKRKWRWIGHVARRGDNHLVKEAINFKMEGRRRVGRPRETWARIAKKEFEGATGFNFEQVTDHAQDRRKWRLHVDAMRAWAAHRD